MKTKIDFKKFVQKSISELKDKECKYANTYLGSMFYIDFGELINKTGRNGNVFQKGETNISVRECYWEIWENITLIGCSNDDDLSFIMNIFIGKFVINISIMNNFLVFKFDNNIDLRCDLTNIDEKIFPEDNIIDVVNNKLSIIYSANAQGEFFIDDMTIVR